jgi:hypothetical protein
LTAAQQNALQANDYNQTVSNKTASYTLVAADKGTRIVMNSASATTITVNTSLFAAGDTLWIENIGTGVCTVTAGTATVSSAGPLYISTNGGGRLVFISASTSIWFPSAINKVLQIVHGSTSTGVTNSTNVYADTNLTATITPQSTSSKILVMISQNGVFKSADNGNSRISLLLLRNGFGLNTFAGNALMTGSLLQQWVPSASTFYLDSPASTSALTYKTQFRNEDNTAFVAVQRENYSTSTIVLLEITA